jgi:hypothetical protein
LTAPSNATQKVRILAWLQEGWTLNPMQALAAFQCFRLGARIYDLRQEGHDIRTTPTPIGDKTFATYKLIGSQLPLDLPPQKGNHHERD